jgi:hypothetical protein
VLVIMSDENIRRSLGQRAGQASTAAGGQG